MKIQILAVSCLVISVLFTVPSVSGAEEQTAALSETKEESLAQVIDLVIASVDGEPLTFSDLRRYLKAKGQQPPANIDIKDPKLLRDFRDFLTDQLLRKEAKESGVTVGDEEVNAYLEEIKRENDLDDAQFQALLKQQGLSYDEYTKEVGQDILRARLVSSRVRSKINVPDEDVMRYLNEHPELMPKAGMLKLRRVFYRFSDLPEASEDQLREKLEEIRKKCEDGELLREVAGAQSEDLGYVYPKDLRDEMREAVQNLDAGGVSEVIRTQGGLMVLQVVSRSGEDPNADVDPELKDEIRKQLYESRFKAQMQKFLNEDLPKKYHVEKKI